MSSSTVQPVMPVEQPDNVKDTIESLVVAFILAFVFRGFLVEAFVIPTGSMAPTLYGKHGTQICPDCGWEFAYGLPDRYPEPDQIICPNCSWTSTAHEDLPYHAPGRACKLYDRWFDPTLPMVDPATAERVAHLDFMPRSGDRILVFKWPFDLGGPSLGPHHWDVVVFKNPQNGEDNYIKRLIGMPGEVLEIIDGDIYSCPLEDVDPQTAQLMFEVIDIKHQMLRASDSRDWHELQIAERQQTITRALDGLLRIRRKTPVAQKALWHVVFDQDHLPRSGRLAPPAWVPVDLASAWDARTPRIRFRGLDVDRQVIAFSNKDIEDVYAYNRRRGGEPLDAVGDLSLRFVLVPGDSIGDGVLGLTLTQRQDQFTLELSPSGAIVLKWSAIGAARSQQVLAAGQVPPWQPGIPFGVEFANVDYQVSVRINGQDPPVLLTQDQDYAPQLASLREAPARRRSHVQMFADHLDVTLDHVQLCRDVYYKNSSRKEYPGWGAMGNPILLRAGEYFVLGDNSPASQDSRLWNQPGDYLLKRGPAYQLGTVPGDQLIGQAFFVYWPSGYRIRWLPILKNFGVIPNAGKMRWIR